MIPAARTCHHFQGLNALSERVVEKRNPLPAHFIVGSMALLVDKHRPRSLEALSYHQDLSERLKSLVGSTAYI